MLDYEYILIDVHDLMAANAPFFQKLSTEFPYISYHDILLICTHIPTLQKENDPTFTIYDNLFGTYRFDAERLIENETLTLLIEQLYLGILTQVQDMEYMVLNTYVYDPDNHSLEGERFISPNVMLVRIIDERLNHGPKNRRPFKPKSNLSKLSARFRNTDQRSTDTSK